MVWSPQLFTSQKNCPGESFDVTRLLLSLILSAESTTRAVVLSVATEKNGIFPETFVEMGPGIELSNISIQSFRMEKS